MNNSTLRIVLKSIAEAIFVGCVAGILTYFVLDMYERRQLAIFRECVEKLDTPNKVETCIAVTHPAAPQPTVKKEKP